MEFLKKLPGTAMPHAGGDHYSFRDNDGNQRNAYRCKLSEPGSETITCRVTGEQYERFLKEGSLDKERVINFFPDARKLFSKHDKEQKLSFTVQLVKAVYQSSELTGTEDKYFEAEVWNGSNKYETFRGKDRSQVLANATAYMDRFENSVLTLKTKKTKNLARTVVEKTTYEGRKNLSYVEIELTVQYLIKNDGWVVLPVGM